MQALTSEQKKKLRSAIVSHYPGELRDSLFFEFLKSEVDIDLYQYTAKDLIFQTKVFQLIESLSDSDLRRVLNAFRANCVDDENLMSTADTILVQMDQARSIAIAPPPVPLTAVVVNGGPMEKRYANRLAELMKEVMGTFHFKKVWEDPRALREIAQASLVIVVISREGRDKDPPFQVIQDAVRQLNPPRRFLIAALDSETLNWSEKNISSVEYDDLVHRESFADTRDKPMPISEADIDNIWRVQEIGVELQSAIAAPAFSSAPPPSSNGSPIILLGEAQREASPAVLASIEALKSALKHNGVEFSHWPDGWLTAKPPSPSILARDPVFVRTVEDYETETKLVADELDSALTSLFRTNQASASLLASCRRVLWRPNDALVWDHLEIDQTPGSVGEDLDNLEARSDGPDDFATWLERFAAPDAVILHEVMHDERPPAFIRLLRREIENSLSVTNNRLPFVRVRPFDRLPNFGRDKLTVIAIDDLPVKLGPGFQDRALQRFGQFRLKIDHVINERRTGTLELPILPVAMLVQNADQYRNSAFDLKKGMAGWTPIRIRRNDADELAIEPSDLLAIRNAATELVCRPGGSTKSAGKGSPA